MGVLYTVWPLDQQMRTWLTSEGVEFPHASSRWPTKSELRDVLSGLRNFTIRYTENGLGERWDASVDDPDESELWTLLHAKPEEGNDSVTHIDFEKGSPWLIIALLRVLASSTRPLVLIDDAGSAPLVVDPNTPLVELVDSYCTADPESKQWERMMAGVPAAGSWH